MAVCWGPSTSRRDEYRRRQPGARALERGPQAGLKFNGGHRPGQPAGDDEPEELEVRRDVQGKAMRRNPARNMHPNGGNLALRPMSVAHGCPTFAGRPTFAGCPTF